MPKAANAHGMFIAFELFREHEKAIAVAIRPPPSGWQNFIGHKLVLILLANLSCVTDT